MRAGSIFFGIAKCTGEQFCQLILNASPLACDGGNARSVRWALKEQAMRPTSSYSHRLRHATLV